MASAVANDIDGAAPTLTPHVGAWEGKLASWVPLASLIGLAAASYYSWTMTATGFMGTDLLPYNEILSPWITPYLVAFFIQTGIISYYLSFPRLTFRRPVPTVLATIMFVFLIFITITFSLFSITFTSQGENLTNTRQAEVARIDQSLRNIDALIVRSYVEHLNNLDENFSRACRGQDQTGIARCGAIALGYLGRANSLRERYGGQLGTPTPFPTIVPANIAASVATLHSNRDLLAQRIAAYAAFAAEGRLASQEVVIAYNQAGADLVAMRRDSAGSGADAKGLVLASVFRNISRAWRGEADGHFYLSLTIAFMPEFISVLCATLLVLHSQRSHDAQLLGAVKEVKRHTRLYNTLAGAMDGLIKSRRAWFSKRRAANIEEAVDQSVSDTLGGRNSAA
jgi:hypothetical protein